MKCDKCNKDFEERKIEAHHIFWKCMRKDNMNINDGERIYLCKKHHQIIADYIIPVIWKFVNDKDKCKIAIKQFTKKWVEKKNYN